MQGGRGTTCKRSDSQHSSQTKCQRKRQGKFWQWRRRRATSKIFVVDQISGLRWNCCQIGYKQFLLGSPVYGVVFSGHHQLVLPLVVAAAAAVWYFWPAFFTYFSCLAPSLFSFFLLLRFWPVNETEICFVGSLHMANSSSKNNIKPKRRLKQVAKGQLR